MLTNVLVASSNSLPNIGYVQGLNSIVSILLSQGLTEQQSYWMLLYLLKKCKINDLLSEGFPKVQILNYQLEIYMRNYLPDVIDYLVNFFFEQLLYSIKYNKGEKGFNISYFTTQWFITLFTYELEFDQVKIICVVSNHFTTFYFFRLLHFGVSIWSRDGKCSFELVSH